MTNAPAFAARHLYTPGIDKKTVLCYNTTYSDPALKKRGLTMTVYDTYRRAKRCFTYCAIALLLAALVAACIDLVIFVSLSAGGAAADATHLDQLLYVSVAAGVAGVICCILSACFSHRIRSAEGGSGEGVRALFLFFCALAVMCLILLLVAMVVFLKIGK